MNNNDTSQLRHERSKRDDERTKAGSVGVYAADPTMDDHSGPLMPLRRLLTSRPTPLMKYVSCDRRRFRRLAHDCTIAGRALFGVFLHRGFSTQVRPALFASAATPPG